MNAIDKRTKLFLIPDKVNDFEFCSLKIECSKFTLAISGKTLYELREIGPGSQFDKRPEPKLQSGEPVKSCIIETSDNDHGSVISNPSLICFTEFDITYPVIKWMSSQSEIYTARYHTTHDILDGFSVCLEDSQQIHLISCSITSCLGSFCDVIEENGESFHKLNLVKLYSLLGKRIKKLIQVFSDNPDYSLSSQIMGSLTTMSGQVPKDILELQTIKYSVNFLFGSYLNSELMKSYLDYSKSDFSPLHEFIAGKEKEEKARDIVEDNIGLGNSKLQGRENLQDQKSTKSFQSKKKLVKKVAVGKGALDSFFKRQ